MTKLLISIVILILIGLGAWLFWSASEPASSPTAEPPAAAVSQAPTPVATPVTSPGSGAVEGVVQRLSPADSTVAWSASKILTNHHTGTVPLTSGSITSDGGQIVAAEFVADMTSLSDDDGSARLETHLKSDDFFAVDQYPTASFSLTSATDTQWTGGLTIRGITNEVTFPVTVTSAADSTTVEADLAFDRTRWDITFDSGSIVETLGDKAIKDEVGLTLKLVVSS